MKIHFVISLFFLTVSTPQRVHAEKPSEVLISKLISGTLDNSESKQFASYASTHLEAALEQVGILKFNGNSTFRPDQIAKAINTLKKSEYKGLNSSKYPIWGMSLSWYLVPYGDKISTIPLVHHLGEQSPAYKAGIRNGDAIFKANGNLLRSASSVFTLQRLLNLWPKNTPIDIEIRRDPAAVGRSFGSQPKNQRLKFTIKP